MSELFSKIIKPKTVECSSKIEEYSTQMKSPEWVAELLFQKDCKDTESARQFFKPQGRGIHDAMDMAGLPEFVEELATMDMDNTKIAVHGDYDVDGITGTALMCSGLELAGFKQVQKFLPNRFLEGYGVTPNTIDKFHADGVNWIITVDTGITALEEIKYAKSLGMKVAVVDHHQQGDELPGADYILNPQQRACSYPNPFLCAAGVSYKLIEALWVRVHKDKAKGSPKLNPEQLLDLFTLGTLADMMPVGGENRTLLKKGLQILRNSPRPGIQALIQTAKIEAPELRSQDVLFRLTPMLNSSGRMGDPTLALDLLLATNEQDAALKIEKITKTNIERRAIEDEIWQKALVAKEELELAEGPQEVLVLADKTWHQGVIGIVAAKLVEKFAVPVAVCAIDKEGTLKGSCRTPPGYNWHKALGGQSDLLGKWGGHACAAGFSLDVVNVSAFRTRLNTAAKELNRKVYNTEEIKTHVHISINKINPDTLKWLYWFEPFGNGNESPVFYDEGVLVGRECRVVGKKHLKIRVKKGNRQYDAIAFGMGHLADTLKGSKKKLKVAYIPSWNYFRNQKNIQLQIMGIEYDDQ